MRAFNRPTVERVLADCHLQVLQTVQQAYMLHSTGETVLPFSTFLRPPNQPQDRIIGLPAYLGGAHPIAGIKWISSFPSNLERGLQRASSVMVLNDLTTGFPTALLEASQISAWRTAASAALASAHLHQGNPVPVVGIVGCGTINLRTLDFLARVHPEIGTVVVYDPVPERAEVFARHAERSVRGAEAVVAPTLDNLLESANTVSIATTDSSHWLTLPPPALDTPQVVLHLSLRDLTVDSVLAATNVVDDTDHVCRENTSLDLAQHHTGNRDFVAAEIGDLLTGRAWLPPSARIIFSPFGLGILDLAVADHVVSHGANHAVVLDGFDPGIHSTAGNRTGAPSHA